MKAPRTFAEVIDMSKRDVRGGDSLISLPNAVDVLFTRLSPAKARAALAEVDRATKGLPFRLDTQAGPYFAEYTLWRYAGRPGNTHCDCDDLESKSCRCGLIDRPAWPKSSREAARRLAVAA